MKFYAFTFSSAISKSAPSATGCSFKLSALGSYYKLTHIGKWSDPQLFMRLIPERVKSAEQKI